MVFVPELNCYESVGAGRQARVRTLVVTLVSVAGQFDHPFQKAATIKLRMRRNPVQVTMQPLRLLRNLRNRFHPRLGNDCVQSQVDRNRPRVGKPTRLSMDVADDDEPDRSKHRKTVARIPPANMVDAPPQ
jgi:hypothetical protein